MIIGLPFTRSFSRLQPTTRAALWMLVGGFCAVMMNVLIRLAAERMHPFEVTFFRCLFSLFVMLPILLSAASSAMNNITVKYLVRSERPNTIVALFSVYLTPLSLVPALFVWQWPDLRTLGVLAGLGAIGTLAHLSVARAYLAADARACAPYEYVRLPYAALIGYLLFGEISDAWTWVGAAIIAGAAIYVAPRAAKLARPGRQGPARPAAADR